MWELVAFIVHIIQEIVEERNKRAETAPPRQAFPQDAPSAQPLSDRPKTVQPPAVPSMDLPYERSAWRTVFTLLTLILMAALVVAWIIYMQM
jgi:hypothetical protein